MAPDARRTAAVLLACTLLLAAVAVPASADSGDGNGKGGGKGKSGGNGGGSSGGGNGNGGGNSGGHSGGGSSNGNSDGGSQSSNGNGGGQGSGSGQGSGGSPSSGNSGNGNAQGGASADSPSTGGTNNGQGHGASDSDERPGNGHGPDGAVAPGQDSGGAPAQGPPPAPTHGPPTHAEAQAASTQESSGDGSGSGSSRGASDAWHEFVGFVTDQTQATGNLIEAVHRRSDFAEIFSTEVDAPAVSAAMVLLTGFVMLGLYGAVRMDKIEVLRGLKAGVIRKEDPLLYQEAAIAAGLPEDRWKGLDAASYRKLMRLDPATVAFWMGCEVAAVERWQAGRTLEQDIADGLHVPNAATEHWDAPTKARGSTPAVVAEAVATEN